MGDVHPKVRFVPTATKVSTKAKKVPAATTKSVKAVIQNQVELDAQPVAALPVAAPAPLKVKDINKKTMYMLHGMFKGLYNGRLGMVETSAVVNGKRAFVVKIQNWSTKELNQGICNMVTVGIENLRVATDEDQGIDASAVEGLFSQARLVVSYLEQVTGVTANSRGTKTDPSWTLTSPKGLKVYVDIDVSASDGDIDVYGCIRHNDNSNLEVEIDVCQTDGSGANTISTIKKQIAEDIPAIDELLSILDKFIN